MRMRHRLGTSLGASRIVSIPLILPFSLLNTSSILSRNVSCAQRCGIEQNLRIMATNLRVAARHPLRVTTTFNLHTQRTARAATVPTARARRGVPRRQPWHLPFNHGTTSSVIVHASGGGNDGKAEFGYNRKDVILIGVGLIGGGFFFKWALEASGVDPIMAGNYAQLIIFVGLCFGWIGSYLFRVATKQMTYAKQLDDYENAVMAKRLEEMPEAEIEEMMADIEAEKQRRGGGGGGGPDGGASA